MLLQLYWLFVFGFKATLTAKVISWRSLTQMCSRFSHTSTDTTFFPKPRTTFLACFRDQRRKVSTQTRNKVADSVDQRLDLLILGSPI